MLFDYITLAQNVFTDVLSLVDLYLGLRSSFPTNQRDIEMLLLKRKLQGSHSFNITCAERVFAFKKSEDP
jgi:hypothetical protein